MQIVRINDVEITELFLRGQRVVTFEMVADVHDIDADTVKKSYQRNSHHFTEGKHTFMADEKELQQLKSSGTLSPSATSLRVFTERGYYKLVKPMRDDVSWQVQDEMAEAYFQVSNQLIQLPPLAIQQAAETVSGWIRLAELFEAPKHIALIEASKQVKQLGIDTTPLLQSSAIMDDIKSSEIMLEPTELASALGFRSGKEINKVLERLGLQSRISGQWVATDKAEGLYYRHAWENHGKSGYNYKWNVAKIEERLKEVLEEME